MKSLLPKCGFSLLYVAFLGAAPPVPQEAIEHSEEIEPYVSFLQQQKQSPVDYIMGLFEEHDMVILCERMHPETTQYDLFYDLISDPRFIARVGNVFTEIGTGSMRGEVHDFLFSENLTEREIEKAALNIWRDLTWSPLWEKGNFFDFLKRLYSLNSSLAPGKKVNLYFSDMPFSWEGMTEEKYREFNRTMRHRDRIMAKQITDKFDEIRQSGENRKKALVIMNYRHAFNDRFPWPRGDNIEGGDNTGRYLFEAYPGKVANVMINSMAIQVGNTDRKVILRMIQNGKWDAAFEVADNRSVGFDFADSPFATREKYQDVFTGFVFYKPLEEHRLAVGIPGVFDEGFDNVLLERCAIAGRPMQGDEVRSLISELGRVTTYAYEDKGLGLGGDPDKGMDLTEKDSWLTDSKGHQPAVPQEQDGEREKGKKQ